MKKGKTFLFLFAFIAIVLPSFGLAYCPRCNYRILNNYSKCPKCLLVLDSNYYQEKAVKSTITLRQGYDAFIRHPHANNRAYKANKNAGGDKTGEIGFWGGPCNLRYLITFKIESAMEYSEIDFLNFTPKKALLYISALPQKSNIEIPVVVFPLTRAFVAGFDEFRTRNRTATGCTWYNATKAMPWLHEGGDYDLKCSSHGIIKSGTRNAIDVTEVMDYFFKKFKKTGEWDFPGMIIMSEPVNKTNLSGFVTIYSLDSQNYSVRPELFIQ